MSWSTNTPGTNHSTARRIYAAGCYMRLQGLPVDRSTLAGWVGAAAAEIKPVYLRMKEIVLASAKIVVDETRAPVLDPGRGRTKTGYFWAISRDDRPWGGLDPPAVVYTYAPGRGGEHCTALLAGYTGIVHCDGYTVYKQLADPQRDGGPATLAFCWTHWRRGFVEIDEGGPAPIAHEALERIAALYAIENRIRGRSADERRAIRQKETRPLVEALKTWLENRLAAVSDKSTIAEVIRYGFNHWQGLVRFLDDGRIEMDTNSVERAMRPIAMLESLCTPSSSVCKHWKRVRVNNATRATFPGHRRFDRLRRQVVGTDLMRCAGNNLHSRKDTGFDKAPYRVVCDA
jgi:transposase